LKTWGDIITAQLRLPAFWRATAAKADFVRVLWLKNALVIAFGFGLAMSPRLWIGPRSYPQAPIIAALPALEGLAAYAMFAALFLLATAVVLWRRPRYLIAAFIAIVLIFGMLDQTRWQPWVFQYVFLLAALAMFSWHSDDGDGARRTLNICRLVIAATYIFAGLQKLNINFANNDFAWIIQPVTNLLPLPPTVLQALGFAAPLLQIAFGIGLLTRRFRSVALAAAVAMHLFVLAMFGPAGHNWNNVIWPWTLAMAAFDILLFGGNADFQLRDVIWTRRHHMDGSAFVLFAVLPLLSFVNLWDSYLSAALYSGNLNEAQIYLSDDGQRGLPAAIKTYATHTSDNTNVISFQRWAIEDLNVTPYPETRVYKSIAKRPQVLPDPTQAVLIVREQRMFLSRPEAGFRCWQL
jgi:hypothetical protein